MREVVKGHQVVLQGYLGSSRVEDISVGITFKRPDGSIFQERTTEGIVALGRGHYEAAWQAPGFDSEELVLIAEFDDGIEAPAGRTAWEPLLLVAHGISAPVSRPPVNTIRVEFDPGQPAGLTCRICTRVTPSSNEVTVSGAGRPARRPTPSGVYTAAVFRMTES